MSVHEKKKKKNLSYMFQVMWFWGIKKTLSYHRIIGKR